MAQKKEAPSGELPEKLEKGDLPAMLLGAFAALLPALLVVGGGIYLILWLFFLR